MTNAATKNKKKRKGKKSKKETLHPNVEYLTQLMSYQYPSSVDDRLLDATLASIAGVGESRSISPKFSDPVSDTIKLYKTLDRTPQVKIKFTSDMYHAVNTGVQRFTPISPGGKPSMINLGGTFSNRIECISNLFNLTVGLTIEQLTYLQKNNCLELIEHEKGELGYSITAINHFRNLIQSLRDAEKHRQNYEKSNSSHYTQQKNTALNSSSSSRNSFLELSLVPVKSGAVEKLYSLN